MIISNLKLVNFRNYENLDLNLSSGINVFIGENGTGKTNLVEAINFMTIGKSYRANDDKEMIKFKEEFARIHLEFETIRKEILEAVISNQGKQIFRNDIKLTKLSELSGILLNVLFTPDDVLLFKDSPMERRKLIDMNLSSLYRLYMNDLVQYKNLLKQRNAMLKEKEVNRGYIEVITGQMIPFEYQIFKVRKKFIEEIDSKINEIFKNIDDSPSKLKIIYKSSLDEEDDPTDFKEAAKSKYEMSLEDDIRRGSTSYGVHKDDFLMLLGGKNVATYASQGQNRLASLSLKLTLVKWIKEKTNQDPIIILDDVLSELDENHQNNLINELSSYSQVFITCAKDDIKKEDVNYYVVEENKVYRRN
jgi:DNA replication and repair protein RecF